MRCPKCQYISFGAENRCRNCGYDLSLSPETEPLELPIKNDSERIGPMTDLPLGRPAPRMTADAAPSAVDVGSEPQQTATRPDLPLFSVDAPDDRPLVTPPAVPRAPLSVRRAAPIITRPRQQPSFDAFDGTDAAGRARTESGNGNRAQIGDDTAADDLASPGARIVAGTLDVLLMAGIDLAVTALTLRLLDLRFGDAALLPLLPMIAFFLLLNGGYLVLLTAAGGQTIGKMAAGIRVVPQASAPGSRVPFGAAVVRAAAFLGALLPAGLGLLPIVLSPDRRALHDRLSNTRVVRA